MCDQGALGRVTGSLTLLPTVSPVLRAPLTERSAPRFGRCHQPVGSGAGREMEGAFTVLPSCMAMPSQALPCYNLGLPVGSLAWEVLLHFPCPLRCSETVPAPGLGILCLLSVPSAFGHSVHVCMSVCTCMCMCACACTHMCMCLCAHVCVCSHTIVLSWAVQVPASPIEHEL